jgi:DNA-3-methyladenine glycosylase II
MQLAQRPSREELLAIAERWRPWRGVAAHMLWAYYKVPPDPQDRKKA